MNIPVWSNKICNDLLCPAHTMDGRMDQASNAHLYEIQCKPTAAGLIMKIWLDKGLAQPPQKMCGYRFSGWIIKSCTEHIYQLRSTRLEMILFARTMDGWTDGSIITDFLVDMGINLIIAGSVVDTWIDQMHISISFSVSQSLQGPWNTIAPASAIYAWEYVHCEGKTQQRHSLTIMSTGIAGVAATLLFSCCCLMVALRASAAAASGSSSGPRYNAIFNFGDSASDTGNTCADGRPGPAGVLGIFTRLPYGVTYFRKPTCRCSDGRVYIDFLAQAFGLPFLPPSKAHHRDFQQGANMAIIGGTVLDYTNASLKFTAYDGSMNTQIKNFQQLLPSICGIRQNCKDYLAKSLFVFQLGENDYSIQLVNGSTVDEASKNIPRIVNTIISGVQELIKLGAVDIVVSNIAPMGCFPLYLNMFESSNKGDYDKYGCLRNHDVLFNRHNSFLRSSLSQLQKKHSHTRIMYADLASHIYQIVQDPRRFGFKTALMSCCGKAGAPQRFDLFTMCGMDGSSVCHDPGSHLLWDGMHLSDTANRRIAEGWLSGPYCHPPILR